MTILRQCGLWLALALLVGCGQSERQSVVRTKALNRLQQVGLAFQQYRTEYQVPPDSLERLYAIELLPKGFAQGLVIGETSQGTCIYSTTTFRAVKKGERWGGPSGTAEEDVPAARAIVFIGEKAKMMPSKEFDKLKLDTTIK